MRPMIKNPCESAIALFLGGLKEGTEAPECPISIAERQNEILAASFGLITRKEALAKAEEESRAAREDAEVTKKALGKASSQIKEGGQVAGDSDTATNESLEKALAKAEEESRAAREDAGAAKKALEEALPKGQEESRIVQQALASIELLKSEKATLEEALAKVEEESRAAREDAGAAKKALEEALIQAKKESQIASKKNMVTDEVLKEALAKVEEESRIAKQETLARINRLISENAALEDALKDAQEEIRVASEASREIDLTHYKYISEMIYKLRTPLQSIIGFSKLLLDGSDADESTQKEFLAAIDKQSERLLYVIKELTEISNMQPARSVSRRKDMSIN